MIPPKFKIRYKPTHHDEPPTSIRITIGTIYRDFHPDQARAIADRIHDLTDDIERRAREQDLPNLR